MVVRKNKETGAHAVAMKLQEASNRKSSNNFVCSLNNPRANGLAAATARGSVCLKCPAIMLQSVQQSTNHFIFSIDQAALWVC